jgi:membrane protease YdiL (CAAX protease family)
MEEAAPAEGALPAEPPTEGLRILELGLLLFVAAGRSLVASVHHWWVGAAHSGVSRVSDPAWAALYQIADSVPPIAALIFVLSRQGRRLRDLGLTAQWSDLAWGLALAVLGYLPDAAWVVMPIRQTDALMAPLTLIGILASAASEELVVRAYMMSEVLALTDGAFLAVASSTCFQALYHLYQGRWSALLAAVTFLIYSLFYWRTRRVTPVILAHFGHNLWLSFLRPGV